MHYFLYPIKDTTISNQPDLLTKNMGLDEILEVEKTIQDLSCSGGKGAVLSRALLQFDVSSISASMAAGRISNPQFFLSLKTAESSQVPTSYNIAAWPLAKSWLMGTGYKFDGATVSDGASWKYSDSGSVKWANPLSSASYATDCNGGGVWYVSASLLGTGSGYAQPPYVSPNPVNLFPDCACGITTGVRFTSVRADNFMVNSLFTSSISVTIYSGSTINVWSGTVSGSGASSNGFVPPPTSYRIELYDGAVLVATATGSGTAGNYFPSASYNVPSGSLPRTLTLKGLNSSATTASNLILSSTLVIEGHLSASGPLKSLFGDFVASGYSPNTHPVTGATPITLTATLYTTGSATSRVGGTDVYAKLFGGSYVTSSILTTTISGIDVTSLNINPYGTWAVAGSSGQIILSSTGSLDTGSYTLAILTDTQSELSAPYSVSSGSYGSIETFNQQTSDVYMDVTNAVMGWIYGIIPNYGLILMHSDETSGTDFGKLRFFSKESNTIYQPRLDVMWSDVVLSPTASDGTSLLPLDSSKPSVVGVTVNKEYKRGSIVRINVNGRPKYPIKTFTNKRSDYIEPMYLPEESYYSIKDAESAETIQAFDAYTKLSSDENGNYFMLDTTGLPQERYYNVEIRSEISGSVNTFSSPITFKISR